MAAASEKKGVTRRLYSLYPEHVEMLKQLSKKAKMPASQYLRELIEVAFTEKFEKTQYGQSN